MHTHTLPVQESRLSDSLMSLLKVSFGALFIAFCAQIRIPLLFTPIAITLQTLAIMLLGGVFRKRETVGSVLLYLGLVLAGFPLLSGAHAEPAFLLGPKAGYLIGMAFQGFLDAHFGARFRRSGSAPLLFCGLLAGSAVTLGMGAIGLARFVGWANILPLGVLPFLPGDLVKVAMATSLLTRLRK